MLSRLAALLLVLSAAVAPAAEPPVFLDSEHLFGKEAVERIVQIAEDLRKGHKLDLVIETMRSTVNVTPETARHMRARTIAQTLREDAQNRADDLGVNGLYILITTHPSHVTVIAYPADRERDWETSDYKREDLRKALARMSMTDESSRDRTLVAAIEKYRGRIGEARRPSPMDLLPPLVVSGCLVGLWIVLLVIRRQLTRTRKPMPIYQPAMLGNIFGVPAGFWIHDRLFQEERAAVAAERRSTESEPTGEPASESDVTLEGDT